MGALSIKRGTKMQLAKEAAVGQQPVFNMIISGFDTDDGWETAGSR